MRGLSCIPVEVVAGAPGRVVTARCVCPRDEEAPVAAVLQRFPDRLVIRPHVRWQQCWCYATDGPRRQPARGHARGGRGTRVPVYTALDVLGVLLGHRALPLEHFFRARRGGGLPNVVRIIHVEGHDADLAELCAVAVAGFVARHRHQAALEVVRRRPLRYQWRWGWGRQGGGVGGGTISRSRRQNHDQHCCHYTCRHSRRRRIEAEAAEGTRVVRTRSSAAGTVTAENQTAVTLPHPPCRQFPTGVDKQQ